MREAASRMCSAPSVFPYTNPFLSLIGLQILISRFRSASILLLAKLWLAILFLSFVLIFSFLLLLGFLNFASPPYLSLALASVDWGGMSTEESSTDIVTAPASQSEMDALLLGRIKVCFLPFSFHLNLMINKNHHPRDTKLPSSCCQEV